MLRGVFAAICLLPPTIMMGATLPAVARWVETTPRGVSWLGFFYGGNTIGAVFGCLLAGFYLLRVFDMGMATFVAAALNVAVGLVSLAIAKATAGQAPSTALAPKARAYWPVYIAIALSGATALGAEVIWTRLLGLMLGLVLAFVQETLDTSIGTIEDVEGYLQVPVIGIVPHIDVRETVQRLIERRPALARVEPEVLQSHALLITHFDPKSPVAEAYRTLRTNLQFIRMERAGKLLVFTSPTLQEGKTTTIVNVALTMAQNGQRVLQFRDTVEAAGEQSGKFRTCR